MSSLGSFANRSTRLTAIKSLNAVDSIYKILPNAKINYFQDLDQLRKHLGITIRLNKEEPIHNVERMYIRHNDEDIEITSSVLDDLRTGRMTISFGKSSDKVMLTVRS
jgi:hypothetical protein